jgi:hypothetical protein
LVYRQNIHGSSRGFFVEPCLASLLAFCVFFGRYGSDRTSDLLNGRVLAVNRNHIFMTKIQNLALLSVIWTYSAWAKWFASQFLANNNHEPVSQTTLMNVASGIVLDALMDGKILARGRPKWIPRTPWRRQPSDAIEYEDISKEAWRLVGIKMEPHPNSLWRAVLFPRWKVDPKRIKKLLDYDSVIVNSREFEKLWPRVDKFTDNARKKLLKKARKAGADPEYIERLRQGHMATWP